MTRARGPIRVMVVDDSALVRETMTRILGLDPAIEVVAVAADPLIAMAKLAKTPADVLILDIEMPRMDGLTYLRKIMSEEPMPVVVCSALTPRGAETTLRALEYGAVEIVPKPRLGSREALEEAAVLVTDAVKAAAGARLRPVAPPMEVPPKLTADAVLGKGRPGGAPTFSTTDKVVVAGASTGGTEAILSFLSAFPPDSPGMVIVQHMPEHFTTAFARRLDGIVPNLTVKEAEDGDAVLRGRALIAPGNRHTLLARSGVRFHVEVTGGPLVTRHRPSVDVLFRSAARFAGRNAIGVIMTGMGDDGARGMLEMKEAGATTFAQDEESCVVYGMPREAVRTGAVDQVLPLDRIPAAVLRAAEAKP